MPKKTNLLTFYCPICDMYLDNNTIDYKTHFTDGSVCKLSKILYSPKFVNKKSVKTYYCEICDYWGNNKQEIKTHIQTKIHKSNLVSKKVSKKNEEIYKCEKCDYTTPRKYNLKRHIDTKHKFADKVSNTDFICECGKKYKYKRSYERHINECKIYKKNKNDISIIKKTDEFQNILENKDNNGDMKDILLTVLNDYKQLVSKAIEQPKIVNNSQNITNQQNNTSFSIKNYLNTECKNAMNLSDYVNQIKLTFDDLLYMKEHGIVKSFENTFVKGLCEMDKTLRPIHCSDTKRGNFYVKDHDTWDKDNAHEQIITTLKRITDLQCDALKQWKLMNRDWLDNDVKQECANVITRKIVDIYGDKIQKQILNLLKQLNIQP
tara:strand:- start:4324 stop:5454 length:1131 start_codon:yes stop_codon:yes gene_type:complete